jgi:uncharacterized membrane protein
MESTDQFNFSIFKPRNLHGKKNRNVIFSMLVIWAVAVFGFQFLLRIIEKPTPEKSLTVFESVWPGASEDNLDGPGYSSLLRSLVLVRGKSTLKPADQEILNGAITHFLFRIVPDDARTEILSLVDEAAGLTGKIQKASDEEFINIRNQIGDKYKRMAELTMPYTGFSPASLEATILVRSIRANYPISLKENSLEKLPSVMKLYLTHNQSVLTDTRFLGFPFHYFYTAFFLLVLFICLCIVYNILIEWRLNKEGVVE